MNTAAEIIVELSSRGVVLTPVKDTLHVRPRSRLRDADLRRLKEHKPEIIDRLSAAIAAADNAVGEPPSPLEPEEKAAVACLVRSECRSRGDCHHVAQALDVRSDVADAYIRDLIAACEKCAATRAYHIALAGGER